MIGHKLAYYLKTIPAVVDVLGDSLYPGHAPQNTPLPYCLIRVIGGQPDYHLAGEIGDLAKIVEVDVYAGNRTKANHISELIRNAPLSGYDGGTWDDTVVKAALITSDAIEIDQPPTDGSDWWIYRTVTQYRITYERTVT